MASSVVISPSFGESPLISNSGPGDPNTGTGYFATSWRRMLAMQSNPGVRSAASYRVVESAGGSGMFVDVTMDGGGALVQPTTRPDELWLIPEHAGTITLDVAAADASNPRIDRVVLLVQDHEVDASGLGQASVEILAGAPTAGAALTNLDGTPDLPDNSLHLGYVHVAANATAVGSADIDTYRWLAHGKNVMVGESRDLWHTAVDDGWLPEDGSSLSARAYDRLAAKLGSTGGFVALPDPRGRTKVAAGQGSGLTNRTLKTTFGEENHSLSAAELGPHTHGPGTLSTNANGSHQHGSATGGNNLCGFVDNGTGGTVVATTLSAPDVAIYDTATNIAGAHSHSVVAGATASAGSGTGHNNVQPSIGVASHIFTGTVV